MSPPLPGILQATDLAGSRQSARRQQVTPAVWVRQALRAARRGKSGAAASKKLAVVRAAARHAFPSPDIGRMLDEIERGYLDESPR